MQTQYGSQSLGMGAIFQYIGSGVQVITGMIFYIIIVRAFDLTIVGTITFFISILGLFNVIFNFGLGISAQHFISYYKGNQKLSSLKTISKKIMLFAILLSITAFSMLTLLNQYIGIVFLHSDLYTIPLFLLSFVLVGYILFGILNGMILGFQNFKASAVINIIVWLIYYFGSITLVLFYKKLDYIIFGWLIGIFLGVIIQSMIIYKTLKEIDTLDSTKEFPNLLKYSFPLFISGVIIYGAAYSDRFIVAGLLNLSYLGVYNYALMIASSLMFLAFPFNNLLLPKLSELFAKGEKGTVREVVKVSNKLLSSIYIPIGFIFISTSPIILDLIGGQKLLIDTFPLFIMIGSTSIFVSQNILSQVVSAFRKTKLFLISSTTALGTNTVISIFLIPKIGILGASIGFSSVYLVVFLILYYFTSREGIVVLDVRGISKVWIATLSCSGVIYLGEILTKFQLWCVAPLVIIGILVYISLIRNLKLFNAHEKELINSILNLKLKLISRIVAAIFSL